MEFKGKYLLQSPVSGQLFEDKEWLLEAPEEKQPHLLRTIYSDRQLEVGPENQGMYRFSTWLPVRRFLEGSSAPVTYHSQGLGEYLKLENLFITFSGYWPEKGAMMRTCSFKETEAYSVCGRLDPSVQKVLVVASAGNTARAFARVCSDNRIRLLLCVPLDALDALWFDTPLDPCVKLISTPAGSDYFDAIRLADMICRMEGFLPEGGAKNVARRDGMGTTVLSAASLMGRIPGYYFQAIGSGTGAIAAWEANLRLISDGRFGSHKMKLMLSQNHPFQPIREAWLAGSRQLLPLDDDLARKQIRDIAAKVLSNRKPPYSPAGGLYDALKDSGGDITALTNEETASAARLFMETEGIDLHPAAAVATASLILAARKHQVKPEDFIMLNITGGGEQRFKADKKPVYLQPNWVSGIPSSTKELETILSAKQFF